MVLDASWVIFIVRSWENKTKQLLAGLRLLHPGARLLIEQQDFFTTNIPV
jgi:hypothetical protein